MLHHEFWTDYQPQKSFKELQKEADNFAKHQESGMLKILEMKSDPDIFEVTKHNPTLRTLEMFN